MRKIFALTLALMLTLGVSTAALAAWNVGGTGSGAAQADQIPPIMNVSANRSGETTTLSWTPIAFSSGDPIGVTVSRTQTLPTGTTVAVPNCEGAQAGCTDSTPEGRWVYTVGGRHHNWLGLTGVSGNVDVPPDTPSGAAQSGSGDPVTIIWTDNSAIEDGYRLERNVDGAGWVTAASVGANSTSAQDALPLTCGVPTQYRVLATHGVLGDSAASNGVVVSGPTCATPEIHVSAISHSGTNSSRTVVVTIQDQFGSLVQDVTVSLQVVQHRSAGDGVVYNESDACTTGPVGTCTVGFDRQASGPPAQHAVRWTATVTDLVKGGHSYDSADNEVSEVGADW